MLSKDIPTADPLRGPRLPVHKASPCLDYTNIQCKKDTWHGHESKTTFPNNSCLNDDLRRYEKLASTSKFSLTETTEENNKTVPSQITQSLARLAALTRHGTKPRLYSQKNSRTLVFSQQQTDCHPASMLTASRLHLPPPRSMNGPHSHNQVINYNSPLLQCDKHQAAIPHTCQLIQTRATVSINTTDSSNMPNSLHFRRPTRTISMWSNLHHP